MDYLDLLTASLADFVSEVEVYKDDYGTFFAFFEELEGYDGGPITIAIGYGSEGLVDLSEALDRPPMYIEEEDFDG